MGDDGTLDGVEEKVVPTLEGVEDKDILTLQSEEEEIELTRQGVEDSHCRQMVPITSKKSHEQA